MTTAYYSLNELRGLPGLPVADRALRDLVKSFISRPREGRGGGLEYSAESLPEFARKAIGQREAIAQIPFEIHSEYGYTNPDIRPEQARADSKAWYLHALDKFQQTHDLTATKAREYFTLAIRLGLIKIPEVVSSIVKKVSITTLRRWEQVSKVMGLDALNGMWQGRKSQLDVFAELGEGFTKLLIYTAKQIELELRKKFEGHKIPKLRAISNYKRKWAKEHPREFVHTVEGAAAYKNKFGQGKEGSLSEKVTGPNQLWMLDGTKTDVLLADGTRHWIIGLIDVYSRRVVLVLSKTNDANAVVNGLLAKGLLKLGVPTTLKIDNGSEYVNNQFENACNELEIEIDLCAGGSPWQKGIIERFFGTLTRAAEKGLPGYVGANIKERAAWDKITGTLTPIEFQAKLDTYVNYYNTQHYHSSIKCTPMEKWAQGVQAGTVIRTIDNPQVLMRLLTAARKRRVGAEGIQYDSYKFASESPLYEELKGQDVWIKMEPSDASTIYAQNQKGEYLFTAFCPELVGMTRAELVARLKKNRKVAKKFKQESLSFYEHTDPAKHAELVTFQKTLPANLPAIEKARRLEEAIHNDKPAPKVHLEITQDAIELDAIPVDPLDRYRWYRSRIHSGQCFSTDKVLDFLRSIESKKQNWSAVIESDLRWVTPQELWEGRPIEYEWELAKAATILKPKHESMPWRAYQTCYLMSDLNSTQSQFMRDFESHPDNQHLIPILQHFKIYRADLLNTALADNPNTTADNWRFEAGYFQRYYQYAERDLLHCVAGHEPVKNPDYDWANHQSIVQRRKEAS
jgi:putative transposase